MIDPNLSKEKNTIQAFRMPISRFDKFETVSKCLLGSVFFLSLLMPFNQRVLAFEISFLDGEVSGRFDTRLSLGFSARVEDRDDAIIGIGNGGTGTSLNGDNGNLNYKAGQLFSASTKATHELQLQWKNFEFFARFFYFKDFAVQNTQRTKLSKTAQGLSERDIRPLDAYGVGNFEPFGKSMTVKVGNQVISWGESTFISHSINTINPVDVSKLRVAGAELRDALLPVPAIDVNVDFTDKISVEAYYQFGWRRTEIEPEGTFFSTDDVLSPGATSLVLAGGDNPPAAGAIIPRGGDRNARDFGEFGFAVRLFEPALNDTEFGFYYIHYHSRRPLAGSTRISGALSTTSVFAEYPPDIDLLGASFNTVFSATGIALQGEISYRFDQPLAVDDQELLVSTLNACGSMGRASQLGCGSGPGQDISGFRRKEVIQAQATLTKILGSTFGADQVVFLGEAGVTWVPNLESQSVLRYEGPGTTKSGDPGTAVFNGTAVQTDGFATESSWGYRLLGRLVFNNAIGPVTLTPQVAFSHDVNGTTPLPIGNFVEDRKTVTMSLGATYLVNWNARIAYTNFFGAGSFNVRNDRDFVSTVVSYAF